MPKKIIKLKEHTLLTQEEKNKFIELVVWKKNAKIICRVSRRGWCKSKGDQND